MFYFTTEQHVEFISSDSHFVTDRFLELHGALHPRVRNHNLDFHPRWQKTAIVSTQSVASLENQADSIVLTYMRPQEQATAVERRMRQEAANINREIDLFAHPVVELRLTPDHFAIELLMSPRAWFDQQNLVGKLDRPQHRADFRKLIRGLAPDYRLGFWGGTHLDDMHLTVGHLANPRVFDEWMNTFCDGLDWFRIGRWYRHDDPMVDSEQIVSEAFAALKALHPVYNFLLWSSNNDFIEFYDKRQKRGPRYN